MSENGGAAALPLRDVREVVFYRPDFRSWSGKFSLREAADYELERSPVKLDALQ
jgi:hypothetical protein